MIYHCQSAWKVLCSSTQITYVMDVDLSGGLCGRRWPILQVYITAVLPSACDATIFYNGPCSLWVVSYHRIWYYRFCMSKLFWVSTSFYVNLSVDACTNSLQTHLYHIHTRQVVYQVAQTQLPCLHIAVSHILESRGVCCPNENVTGTHFDIDHRYETLAFVPQIDSAFETTYHFFPRTFSPGLQFRLPRF
jgi:hypothetical protein